jgi:large subunit ribosomal protein L37e
MTKGTPTMGKRSTGKLHITCRRCGKKSFHMKRAVCSSCGYGKSSRMRSYSWTKKKPKL